MARRRRKVSNSSLDSSVVWTAYRRPDLQAVSSRCGDRDIPQGAAEFLQMKMKASDFDRERRRERREKKEEGGKTEESPKRHVQGPTPFEKQTDRPQIIDQFPDVNENRFNMLSDNSPIYSKAKKVPTPNLAKLLPRISGHSQEKWQQAEYKPNFKAVWKKHTKDFAFEKVVGRKLAESPHTNASFHDVSYSQVQSKVPSPDFRRSVPKSHSPQLPIHMQNIISWQGLYNVSEKTLEMNSTIAQSHYRTTSQ